MELKEFISATVSAVVDATSALQARYSEADVLINPPSAQSGSDVYQAGSSNYTMRRVQNISFDVAVTATSETSGKGRAGIRVLSIEMGGEVGKSATAESVSRVSFSVPITLKPTEHEAKNRDKGLQEKAEQKAAFERAATSRGRI